MRKTLDGVLFIAPSTSKYKKYGAYVNGKKYSFGDIRYEQFHDKIGYYSDWDHNDRREQYISRHRNDKLNEYSPGYFSMNYLWQVYIMWFFLSVVFLPFSKDISDKCRIRWARKYLKNFQDHPSHSI